MGTGFATACDECTIKLRRDALCRHSAILSSIVSPVGLRGSNSLRLLDRLLGFELSKIVLQFFLQLGARAFSDMRLATQLVGCRGAPRLGVQLNPSVIYGCVWLLRRATPVQKSSWRSLVKTGITTSQLPVGRVQLIAHAFLLSVIQTHARCRALR